MTSLDEAVYDADVIHDLECALGRAIVDSLLDAFRTELRVRPALIAQQVETGDIEGARASAHALKGAALVVGARGIAASASRVEHADEDLIRGFVVDLMRSPGVADQHCSGDGG